MAKKARLPINPTPTQQRPAWIGFAVTGLIAAACGAAISASVLPRAASPKPTSPAAVAPAATTPPTPPATAPVSGADTNATAGNTMPTPDLILDLPPAKAALNLGNWSYDHKNWPAAIAYYTEAVKRGFGGNPDVLTDLGNAYRFAGQPQKALAQYFLAQQKQPSHETSLFNQGDVYANDLGDPKKAIDVWKQYLKRFPNGVHHEDAAHLIELTEAHSSMDKGGAPGTSAQ
ncbi:MAG: tetratricopeptide repeat protein [Capsulimonas sp.]|uniref:tetratricopeptide repeat protein n=1 Tax=Capsulimonas sp. TaxID=2494211 RepID=UPI003266C00B